MDSGDWGRLFHHLRQACPSTPLRENTAHDLELIDAVTALDGTAFVIDGVGARGEQAERSVIAVSAATGNQLWAERSTCDSGGIMLLADTSSGQVALHRDASGEATIVNARTGDLLYSLPIFPTIGFSPNVTTWLAHHPSGRDSL